MERNVEDDSTLERIAQATPPALSEAVSSVLSFYGSELTSHASTAVGFIVAFFALVQVRSSLNFALLFLSLFVVMLGAVYSGIRLVYWASLSSALLHGYLFRMRNFAGGASQMGSLPIPHAFVNEYARANLVKELKKRGSFYNRKGLPFATSVCVAFAVALVLASVL